MGFSNSNSEQIDYLKLNAKADESTTPFFTLVKKNESGKWGTEGSFDQISGYVIGISRRESEWQGSPIYSVRIKFLDDQDPTKKFQVEATYNSLTYSILNSLISLQKELPIRIKVYSKASNSDGKFYAAAYVEANGSRLDWGIPLNEIPKPTVGMVGKKKVVDDSVVVEYFHSVIDGLTEKFGPAYASQSTQQPPDPQPSTPPPGAQATMGTTARPSALEQARATASAAQEPEPIMPPGTDDDLPF